MLGDRPVRIGFARLQGRVAFCCALGIALMLGILTPSQAQKSSGKAKSSAPAKQKVGGSNKPLPAQSKATSFYTPEGQQQIADAIITDVLDELKDKADEHFDYGEFNHSINLFRIVVQGNPRDVESFSNAAYLLWSTGQNDVAISVLKAGLAANPNDYYMYDELGSFFFLRVKDYPQAVAYYEKAVKYKCPFFTWTGLAHCYEKQKQWGKAVKAWEQASNYVTVDGVAPEQSRSNHSMIQNNLARARAELAKNPK